jgi:xanthine dehydrogenase accessory factor
VIVVTDTANGEQRLVKAKDFATDPLRTELSKQLRMGKSGTVEAGGKKLFFNVYAPTAKLVIVGAVHISQALAPLARSLDYDVTVVDPRTAFASRSAFPTCRWSPNGPTWRCHRSMSTIIRRSSR